MSPSIARLCRFPRKRRACRSNLFDMTMIRAATAAHHVQLRQAVLELSMLHAEFNGVSNIKVGGFVQFRVALPRRIGAQAANSLRPRFPSRQHVLEMSGMSAVDHVVGGIALPLHALSRLGLPSTRTPTHLPKSLLERCPQEPHSLRRQITVDSHCLRFLSAKRHAHPCELQPCCDWLASSLDHYANPTANLHLGWWPTLT